MALHSALTKEIDEGPSGPQIGAFFDLDQTLLAGFSAAAFVRDGLRQGRLRPADFLRGLSVATQFQLGRLSFSGLVAATAGTLRGTAEADFEQIGERIFTEQLAGNVYPEARALVQAHQRQGHTLAIVSSATRYQIEPLARDLDIPHVLCTQLKVRRGQFTGDIVRPACYGEGKATAAKKLAKAHGIDLVQSYFYTDSDEDLPLLDLVGRPRPTNPSRRLAEIAAKRGWPARRFTSRGTPGAAEILRTALAAGSLAPSLLLGLPVGLLNSSWRLGVNIAVAAWGELATAFAGLELRVTGEEHVWSHRPAVFIFNHQSGVDFLLLCKLLRRDIVGIAKQEIRRNPIFGPAFALAGTVFIDRADREKAIQALQPAIEALREGLSIVIAPEGTRSPTPRLGRFKKGAFHLAMAAKVPIVPIVFRNALDALPKQGYVIRPATVEAVVLPPIPTADWNAEELDERIAAIRQLYEQTLHAW
jgi:putative phosphoserine phosphatase/1-acylglycerol-3-phosphate O-acyltransferase